MYPRPLLRLEHLAVLIKCGLFHVLVSTPLAMRLQGQRNVSPLLSRRLKNLWCYSEVWERIRYREGCKGDMGEHWTKGSISMWYFNAVVEGFPIHTVWKAGTSYIHFIISKTFIFSKKERKKMVNFLFLLRSKKLSIWLLLIPLSSKSSRTMLLS